MAAVLLSACGGGSGAEESTPTPTVAATTNTPAPTPTEVPATSDFDYVVVEGDTLSGIADQFSISLDTLLTANGLTADSQLSVGDVLHIVGGAGAPALTPGPTLDPSIPIENPAGRGWMLPVANACLPLDDNQMPNAPRVYRAGVHEGVDFFTDFACTDVIINTPALAAKGGRVVRADHEYLPLTQEEIDDLLARSAEQGFTDTNALDSFRGRQVWIDHGDGLVTRYCHLNDIPDEVEIGGTVTQGQVVGLIGDSGTPESLSNPQYEIHLHFEIRVGSTFLGAGLSAIETRAVYQDAFSPE
ncbi:MAG: LysM peptidoglycan-binding domain-containing M23 family metallopeptidase [Dehalococcoidia bacterium]